MQEAGRNRLLFVFSRSLLKFETSKYLEKNSWNSFATLALLPDRIEKNITCLSFLMLLNRNSCIFGVGSIYNKSMYNMIFVQRYYFRILFFFFFFIIEKCVLAIYIRRILRIFCNIRKLPVFLIVFNPYYKRCCDRWLLDVYIINV